MHSTYKYCDRHGLPYKRCGKLVVATEEAELDRLEALFERAKKNGMRNICIFYHILKKSYLRNDVLDAAKVPDVRMVDEKEIRDLEPDCRGLRAIWSPHTGIIDWGQVKGGVGWGWVGGSVANDSS